jgi:hypothetical protein
MGLFNYIKSALGGNDKAAAKAAEQPNEKETGPVYDDIIKSAYRELEENGQRYWWSIKTGELKSYTEKLLSLTDKQKVAFIFKTANAVHSFHKGRSSYSSDDKDWLRIQIADAFMRQLLKTRLVLDDDDIELISATFISRNKYSSHNLLHWPVNLLVSQMEKQLKERPVTEKLTQVLTKLREHLDREDAYSQIKEKTKLLQKIDDILFKSNDANSNIIKPTFFPGDDEFGQYANETIRAMNDADRQQWFKLMLHAQKASGSKPSKKYTDEVKELFKDFGADKYKQQLNDWFSFLIAMKVKTTQHTQRFGNQEYNFENHQYLTPPNIDMLKGFVWSCVHFHDKATLFNIAQLAGRAYKKIPGQGPTAAAIGNACIYVLASSKGLDGLGHLSRLKLRVQQSSTQNLIEKYMLEAATKQGVSLHEIEDMAVDDHGLQDAKKEYELEGYKAVLQICGVGKTTLEWFKPDGSPQKAVPSIVKEKQAAKLKKIKDTIKQVELTTSAQRDRLDRMFKSTRTIPGSKFKEFYFDHGLMSWLAHKIIWTVEKAGNKHALIFLNGKWFNNNSEETAVSMDDDTSFSLWHPVFETVASIKAWRDFMMHHQIVQPLKQAFREVYILTDAEINTVTYSNRMAAHILKQHQFNSLAKIRGWKYALIGNFDNGGNDCASTDLKEYGLRAEFWVNEVAADDAMNDTGIWNYVATDQLRFLDAATNTVKELIEIPAVLLSEILRDLDLFVGVASVGNDPNWRDSGGLPGYNDYWQSYSFGDLNELAKTRRSILEGLVPRLKIAKVAELRDKFLVIKGKLRTYKIHIGSTNILMEPNDQYLCIVPDRGKKEIPDNVFLPFEGDNGLSVILSKAMLLADDDKITDTTITSQINRK